MDIRTVVAEMRDKARLLREDAEMNRINAARLEADADELDLKAKRVLRGEAVER